MTQETSGFMERQLLERMIGAGVLLVALVIIVPAILDGRPDVEDTSQSSATGRDAPGSAVPLRTHTIRLDRRPESPPVARQAVVPASPPRAAEPESETQAATISTLTTPAPTAVTEPLPQPAPTPAPRQAEPPKPPAVAASERVGWVVQLGSFSQKANAQRLAEDTRAKGFPAFLMPLERSGKTLYRVRIGPRDTRESAGELAASLSKAGFTGQVVEQKPNDS